MDGNRERSGLARLLQTIAAIKGIPIDPFEPVDEKRRTVVIGELKETEQAAAAQRLRDRYNLRAASSANTHLSNAFIAGAEIALVLGICGFMLGADSKVLRACLLPAFLLSVFATALLVAGVIRARSMGKPSHVGDELLEVAAQVKAGKSEQEALCEAASRSMKQRSRLHVNDLFGVWSMYVLLAALVAFGAGITLYVFGSLFM